MFHAKHFLIFQIQLHRIVPKMDFQTEKSLFSRPFSTQPMYTSITTETPLIAQTLKMWMQLAISTEQDGTYLPAISLPCLQPTATTQCSFLMTPSTTMPTPRCVKQHTDSLQGTTGCGGTLEARTFKKTSQAIQASFSLMENLTPREQAELMPTSQQVLPSKFYTSKMQLIT